jgi:hypothetical protein
MTPVLKCYRLRPNMPYDEELVWELVQRHAGYISIKSDCIDFFMPREYSLLLQIAFPLLIRTPSLDYV